MRVLIVLGAAALCASAATAAPAPGTSWGKAGVSLDAYRQDASRCLNLVAQIDLVGTQPANALVRATRRIDNIYAQIGGENSFEAQLRVGQQVNNVVEFTQPRLRFNQVRTLMRTAMDACLTELGYSRFRLTEAQREHLRHLRYGQPARHAYLHSLASDPVVLRAQAAPEDPE